MSKGAHVNRWALDEFLKKALNGFMIVILHKGVYFARPVLCESSYA